MLMEKVSKMVFVLFFIDNEYRYVRDRIEFSGTSINGDRWKMNAMNGTKGEKIGTFKASIDLEDAEAFANKLSSIEKFPDAVLASPRDQQGYLDIFYSTPCHSARIDAFTARGNENVEALVYELLAKYGCVIGEEDEGSKA